MSYLLLLFIFLVPAFAGLEKIEIKNLDFHYIYPEGSGQVEKFGIGIGASRPKQAYPIAVFRRDHSFDVISEFIDFQWMNPIPFAHNIQAASMEKFNLKIDKGEHFLKGDWLKFTGEKTGELFFEKFNAACKGQSLIQNPILRIKADCLEMMEVVVDHMDLPFEFLNTISQELPETDQPTDSDLPANDFSLSMEKGDFFSYVRIKYVVRAYLKVWGHTQFENNGKTLAIRIDQIKYGVLPVTPVVMNQLQRQIKHPKVTINPPWIRIQLGN